MTASDVRETSKPTRVVFAPDSFKGTIRAAAAAQAMADGWAAVRPHDELVCLPMADGGEGTLDAFASAVPGARRMPVTVTGPTGTPVDTCWLLLPADHGPAATAVVELANTSGIELVADATALRPLDASTIGFGQAIRDALEYGATRLVLAVGSSASSDGGAGLLHALGARVVDADGSPVGPGARGLENVAHVDLGGLVPLPRDGALVLTDVVSPLLGPDGAAAVFAPQKGANADEVMRIEWALARWSRAVGFDPRTPGAGAAGGAGFGLMAWGAQAAPGAVTIADLVALRASIEGAALVVTGEGSWDGQSPHGKAPSVVIAQAREAGVPVALVAGRILARPVGVVAAISLAKTAGSPDRAMADAARWLREAGARLARESVEGVT
ncbi:glycerate kinase [Micromonospora pallida]|uniref:Glycerate kinase n=1 Tax=Micromonospora pallida TaxID=145854 RepID=A0A1C6SI32_9ACTN|nr:glycerate kinase [Micromonospora pallida]SCL29190.1 glycerate kinase [Micromonospora pallida]